MMGRILVVSDHSEVAQLARQAAITLPGATPVIAKDATLLLDLINERPGDVDAVVLGPGTPFVLPLAQRIHSTDALVAILIIVDAAQYGAVSASLRYAPSLGPDVKCFSRDTAGLDIAIEQAGQRTRRRRRHSRSIGDLNQQLVAAPRAPLPPEAFLDRILKVAPMGIGVLDRGGRLRFCNHHAAVLFGARDSRIVGRPLVDVCPALAEQGWEQLVLRCREQEKPVPATFHLIADGTSVVLEIILAPLSAVPEHSELLLVQDVTERTRLEDQLRETGKMQAVAQLAGGVAHDFNNLLTVINGYALMLLEHPALDQNLRETMGEIAQAGTRAAGLTRQLLAFARRQVLQPEACDMDEVLKRLEPMLVALMGARATLEMELSLAPHHVSVDPSQLEQVVVNLVLNARDAIPAHGRVVVRTRRALEHAATCAQGGENQPQAVLEVIDDGMGMDAATIERIFEPFFTTKPAGQGTGLGLSSTYGIVNQSGGHLHVESAPGRGARFEIVLPLSPASTPARPESTPDALPNERSARGGRVLLVESDPSLRRYVNRILTSSGFEIIEASCGQAVLDAWSSMPHAPDLVISSASLPKVQDSHLFRRLLELRADLPLVVMSGDASEAGGLGAVPDNVRIVQKPFAGATLHKVVQDLLARALILRNCGAPDLI